MKTEKQKTKKIKTRFFICLSILFFICVLVFLHLELVVNPIILNIAEAQIDSLGTTAVNDAIFEVINSGEVDYNDIIEIQYDSNNNISSISTNMEKINYLARELAAKAQIYFDKMGGEGFQVAIGAFTGLEVFSQFGPSVTFRLVPIGSFLVKFKSEFQSAGINQTRHAVYVDIDTSISVILPTSSKKICFVTSALVCENIIVGKVPSVYLEGSNALKSSG